MAKYYSKKNSWKDYAVIGGVVLVFVGGWLFLTDKGKSVKDSILGLFKKEEANG